MQYGFDEQTGRLATVVHRDTGFGIPEKTFTQSPTSIASQGTEEAVFVYDGWNLFGEYAYSSSQPASLYPRRTYTWGLDLSGSLQGAGGVGGLLAIETTGGSGYGVYYPLYDGNGNVVATLRDSGGSYTTEGGAYHYDPFGNTIVTAGDYADENPFRFSTKYFDGETGFYYYGYRYYDPVTGRWPSRDPIMELGKMDLTQVKVDLTTKPNEDAYTFVSNNPISKFDILGLTEPQTIFFCVYTATIKCNKVAPKCKCPESDKIQVREVSWISEADARSKVVASMAQKLTKEACGGNPRKCQPDPFSIRPSIRCGRDIT